MRHTAGLGDVTLSGHWLAWLTSFGNLDGPPDPESVYRVDLSKPRLRKYVVDTPASLVSFLGPDDFVLAGNGAVAWTIRQLPFPPGQAGSYPPPSGESLIAAGPGQRATLIATGGAHTISRRRGLTRRRVRHLAPG